MFFDCTFIDKSIVRSTPISPTDPTTGKRNKADVPSGFGSILNAYCWQICAFKGKLYIGSWDAAVIINSLLENAFEDTSITSLDDFIANAPFSSNDVSKIIADFRANSIFKYNWFEWIKALLKSLPKYPEQFGFDMWESCDGEEYCPVSLNGFDNGHNYGLRTLVVTEDRCSMFIGTANPYDGCEVWRMY